MGHVHHSASVPDSVSISSSFPSHYLRKAVSACCISSQASQWPSNLLGLQGIELTATCNQLCQPLLTHSVAVVQILFWKPNPVRRRKLFHDATQSHAEGLKGYIIAAATKWLQGPLLRERMLLTEAPEAQSALPPLVQGDARTMERGPPMPVPFPWMIRWIFRPDFLQRQLAHGSIC